MQTRLRKILVAGIAGLMLTGSLGLIGFTGKGSLPLLCLAEGEAAQWKYYGSSTCGGGSCHASSTPEANRPATEYKTWQSKDRHSKAFNTLFNELSVAMNEALGIEDASKDTRCTKCHTTEGAYKVNKALQGEKYNAEDGVSCDGCHGPAEGWFSAHTKPHKYGDMLKLGMWDTRNIWRRADMCVYCHLQIEPELVDAGHPDLSFELVGHSRREPPHWYERQTWDAVRGWTVGAGVALRESLTKLSLRIKKGRTAGDIDVAAAQAISYLDVFRHVVDTYGTDAEKALATSLNELLKARTLKVPELSELCTKGAAAFDNLARRLAKETPFDQGTIKALWGKISSDRRVLDRIDEFGAEQVAGALVALYSSFKMGEGPRLRAELEVPAELEALLVQPTVYKPEELFDLRSGTDGTTEFNSRKWQERLARVVTLFGPIMALDELEAREPAPGSGRVVSEPVAIPPGPETHAPAPERSATDSSEAPPTASMPPDRSATEPEMTEPEMTEPEKTEPVPAALSELAPVPGEAEKSLDSAGRRRDEPSADLGSSSRSSLRDPKDAVNVGRKNNDLTKVSSRGVLAMGVLGSLFVVVLLGALVARASRAANAKGR